MDSHLYPDYVVPPNYDSLLGKLIVWAETRDMAITRMSRALDEMVISGVPTTAPFHRLIMDIDAWKRGEVDTSFIIKHADELQEPAPSKVGWQEGGWLWWRAVVGGVGRRRLVACALPHITLQRDVHSMRKQHTMPASTGQEHCQGGCQACTQALQGACLDAWGRVYCAVAVVAMWHRCTELLRVE